MLYRSEKTGVIVDFSNNRITVISTNGKDLWEIGTTFPYNSSLPDTWKPYGFKNYLKLIYEDM